MPEPILRSNPPSVSALLIAITIAIGACDDTASSASVVSELASAVATTASTEGVLLCAPTTPQTEACDGLAVGDDCAMVRSDRDASSVAGVCRTAIDGVTLACAPAPHAPPAVAVAACDELLEGDACVFEGRHGDMLAGTCELGGDADALACAPSFTPPSPAFDACDGLDEGDVCSVGSRDGRPAFEGTCALTGRGAITGLACRPEGPRAAAVAACASRLAGETCTLELGRDAVTGSCVALDDAVVCVTSCGRVGGPFDCRERPRDGGAPTTP